MKAFNINLNDCNQRLDRFTAKVTCNMSSTLINKYIRLKRIKVNGKRAENNYKLKTGDLVEMYINDEFFPLPQKSPLFFLNASDKLNIVYEDDNIILCDKPAGLIVHEDDKESSDTLINRILKYLYMKGEFDPEREHCFTPALCNRIDRNTGGIVIGAKNAEALRIINLLIKERLIEKRYLLIACKRPPKQRDIVTSYMKKLEGENRVLVFDKPCEGAKTAITEYELLEYKNGYSLIEVVLHTGRTHQIRAQMAHLGCPLLGDGKYGINREDKHLGFKNQALYSYKLTFDAQKKAGILSYLNKKSFEVKDVYLRREFERITK